MLQRLALLLIVVYFSSFLFVPVATDPAAVDAIKKKDLANIVISLHSACSRQALKAVFVLRDPFFGSIYARGYPEECRSLGNGSREVSLIVGVNQCGTKISEKQDGTFSYEVYMYIQYDKHVQQATDSLVLVECSPRELVVSDSMPSAPLRRWTNDFSTVSTTMSPLTVDCWMEILKGNSPLSQPVTQHVEVGQDLTMVIRIKHADGIMAKVTNCVASDGSSDSQQELIDSNGCTVDPDIMPYLREKSDSSTGLKYFFASFQAFKFPERDNLHLQCRVLICNNTCPLDSCALTKWGHRRRMSREFYGMTGNVLRQMEVYNSVEVQSQLGTPHISTSPSKQTSTVSSDNRPDDLFCLNSTRMVLIMGALLGVLLISLVVTICMCVRARELRRRLLQRQNFPYGRVRDYS